MNQSLNNFDDQDTAEDGINLGFTKELIDDIREKKEANPGMFVSAWQEDTEGLEEKNLEDPVEKWLTAAEEGDLNSVITFLEEDPNILNSRDADGYTALHRASYNNNAIIVDHLLTSGANKEARTNEGWTPLLSASNWANFEIVGRLLSHGADVNAVSNGNLTALHLAVNSRSDEPENIYMTVRYLLQAPGIDAGVIAGNGDTPLMMARRTSERLYNAILNFMERP
uniref:ANK_REP_REGION domain-containing protein n=1 Tax=Caenorhabditis tropicalis TaxID=1561998 RepID=A0A1I7U332_9PELO